MEKTAETVESPIFDQVGEKRDAHLERLRKAGRESKIRKLRVDRETIQGGLTLATIQKDALEEALRKINVEIAELS